MLAFSVVECSGHARETVGSCSTMVFSMGEGVEATVSLKHSSYCAVYHSFSSQYYDEDKAVWNCNAAIYHRHMLTADDGVRRFWCTTSPTVKESNLMMSCLVSLQSFYGTYIHLHVLS